jgi:phosphoribosyl 1,2-cyclic phosphate phosphodiesterase
MLFSGYAGAFSMKITILGSGTSTGVPMVGCRCPVCTSDDPRDKRTRASILVEKGGGYILVDTSTDLRKQAIREQIPHIDAVLFTHSHADHIHGIDDLRGFHFIHQRVIPCYAAADTIAAIAGTFSYIFSGLRTSGYAQLLEPHVVSGPFTLFDCAIVPVPLHHGQMPATGYRFDNAAYLTDCSSIPAASLELLVDLDLLIIDALRYTPHPHHFNIAGALQVAEKLRPKRTVFTHLTHEVSWRDGEKLPHGIEFAFDGMVLELPD